MEIWKDIRGFEGRYQVSNLGLVKSGQGIEVGDWCVRTESEVIPMVRHFSEDGIERPFHAMDLKDCEGFKLVNEF